MSKLKKFPTVARIAVKFVNRAIDERRDLLKLYKESRIAVQSRGIQITNDALKNKMPALKEGKAGLNRLLKNRKEIAKDIPSMKPQGGINRLVNAHGKGIVFRRVGGRIVPMRKK